MAPSDPPAEHVRAALDARLRALLAHDSGTRSGEGPENLHQMRVAVRRMRAALRAARPLLDAGWAGELRAELGWLGRALGPVRDADVLLERLHAPAAGFDQAERDAVETLVGALVEEREAARAHLLTALASDRYIALLHRLADAVSAPPPTPATNRGKTQPDQPQPDEPQSVKPEPDTAAKLTALVATEFRKLRKAVRKAGDDPAEEVLHALRIRGKRLRYTAELAVASVGEPARRLVTATARLQEVLGDHQDARVAQQRVRELVDAMGDVVDVDVIFVAGRLVEREELRCAEARAAWPRAWRRVNRRARWLASAA